MERAHTRRALDRDTQIAVLKKQLAEMESARQVKNLELLRRNERMIRRDAARHKKFLEEYKTPEQVAEEAAAAEVRRLQGIMECAMDDEDDSRVAMEEEEAVEFKLLLQEHRLEFVCHTVRAVHSEFHKVELQRQLILEESARVVASYEKLKVTLSGEEADRRRQIERAHFADWRVLENMKRTDYDRAQTEVKRRIAEAQRRAEQEATERSRQETRNESALLEAEEDELWQAYQERMQRIEARYRERLNTVDYVTSSSSAAAQSDSTMSGRSTELHV